MFDLVLSRFNLFSPQIDFTSFYYTGSIVLKLDLKLVLLFQSEENLTRFGKEDTFVIFLCDRTEARGVENVSFYNCRVSTDFLLSKVDLRNLADLQPFGGDKLLKSLHLIELF